MDSATKNGRRVGTYQAYLKDVMGRSNLKIIQYARVDKARLECCEHILIMNFMMVLPNIADSCFWQQSFRRGIPTTWEKYRGSGKERSYS